LRAETDMNPVNPAIWYLDSALTHPKLILWLVAIAVAVICSYFSAQFFDVLFGPPDSGPRESEKIRAHRHRIFRLTSFFFIICGLIIFHTFVEVTVFTRLYGATQKTRREDVKVWVNTRSGFYYCPDAKLYGQLKPGRQMPEWNALQSGYRPFFGQFCQ
jgi:hypothetical protein